YYEENNKEDAQSDVTLQEPGVNEERGCVLNGTVYGEGSAMHTSELCNYCFCIRGQQQCVQPRCVLPLGGCKPIYSSLSCCPTHYNCSIPVKDLVSRCITRAHTRDKRENPQRSTEQMRKFRLNRCEVNGQIYSEGQMIQQVVRSGCDNCFCLKGKIQCIELECAPPLQGCIPVVTPGKCCPDSYNCNAVDELEGTQDIFPRLSLGKLKIKQRIVLKHVQEQININIERTSVRSLTAPLNHHQHQVIGEGRSNNDITTMTTTEPTTTETTTVTITTAQQTTPETTTGTEETTVTTETTTVVQQTTVEITSETTEESMEEAIPWTIQTETTFMTSMPTTMIIPHDINVANITMHRNVTIVEKEENNTAINGSLPPLRAIPPEIEAILNITHKKDNDYEYDYNEPSLPPSLPNLRIIPFVAADAVPEDHDNVDRVTVYPTQDKLRATDNPPVYYKVSHPNRFSPPIETEGGFVPREPILDGPFYESKYEVPYHTTGPDDEHCRPFGSEYRHGEIISEPSACMMCMCYYGEVLCHETKCPHVKTGCRRLKDKEHGLCCGRVICDDAESPTVVLDRIDVTPNPLQTLQQPPPLLLGGIVPPITVADGVVTPDPFRDVIRTEPAPDLPSLIEDMRPYILERHTTASTTTKPPTTTSKTTPSSPTTVTTTTTKTTTTTMITTTTTEGQVSPATPPVESLEEKIINDGDAVDELEKDETEDGISGLSFDSVLQYLFSEGETTKAPLKTTTTAQTSEVSRSTIEVTTQKVAPEMNITKVHDNVTTDNSIGPTTSSKEPPPGRPPNLEPLPTTTDAAGLGVLKLAGCNIYGRMYRVGRIISELSGPCLECMCTEVGVQCRPLDC
ncbi:hypothetical protein L9F63_011388, partial [Diploptera punctata]